VNLPTIFGLFAVTAMLVFYALEKRSPWFILAFAGACPLGPRLTGFFKALGRSGWSRPSGPSWQLGDGRA
jgi:hypothetical protein